MVTVTPVLGSSEEAGFVPLQRSHGKELEGPGTGGSPTSRPREAPGGKASKIQSPAAGWPWDLGTQ